MDTGLTDWDQGADEFLAQRPNDLMPLYHYTSVVGMVSILGSRRLWLSSAATTNDSTDGAWLEDRLLELDVQQMIASGISRNVEESERWRTLWLESFKLGAPQAYLCCFSERNDLLSQWRAYAADGEGVAIGFDMNGGTIPVVAAWPRMHANPALACTVSKVRYADGQAIALLAKVLEQALRAKPGSEEYLQCQAVLAGERWLVKNPAFTEEQEWRIVNLPVLSSVSRRDEPTTLSAIGRPKFRTSGSRVVSYFELPFSPQAVCELVLGPRCNIDDYELQLFLRERGLDHVTVKTSSATYRS